LLREALCFIFGFGLIAAVNVDVIWTALGTHGGGPVSGPFTAMLWRIGRATLGKREQHRLLSFAGSAIVTLQLILWVSMLWGGWFLVFSARPDAIVDARTHAPADVPSRIYFSAYLLSTLGNGDYIPSTGGWKILCGIATLGGLGTLTMAITFVLQVLSAVVSKRQMAAYISDLGAVPRDILRCAWTGLRFDSLADHLIEITQIIPRYTEEHLAYPVLLYYHSETERTAATLRLASLYELVLLLRSGVALEARMPPMVIEPLFRSLVGFADVVCGEWIEPTDEPPPPPSLSILRELGSPTVDDADFARAMDAVAKERRFFAGLLDADSWPWECVHVNRDGSE
jgi:hypothetical protein